MFEYIIAQSIIFYKRKFFVTRAYAKTEPVRQDDLYFLFSCTKPITCTAGAGYGYGLGVRTLVDCSEGQRSSLGEFGWDGAAGSYVMIDPKHQLSIVFAMHVKNWPTLIGCGHAPIRDMTYDILGL